MALIGISAVFWTIWRFRNEACFENKKLTDPFILIRMIGQLLTDWLILQKNQEKQEEMKWAVKLVEQVANEIFRASRGWRPGIPRLT